VSARIFTCSPPSLGKPFGEGPGGASPIAARGTGDDSSDQVPDLVDVRELAAKLLDLCEREASVTAQGRQVRQTTLFRPSANRLGGDVEQTCYLRCP